MVTYRHRELLYMQKEVHNNNFEFVDPLIGMQISPEKSETLHS